MMRGPRRVFRRQHRIASLQVGAHTTETKNYGIGKGDDVTGITEGPFRYCNFLITCLFSFPRTRRGIFINLYLFPVKKMITMRNLETRGERMLKELMVMTMKSEVHLPLISFYFYIFYFYFKR